MNDSHPIYSVKRVRWDLVETGQVAVFVPLQASDRIEGLSLPCGRQLPGLRRAPDKSTRDQNTSPNTCVPRGARDELREAKLRQKFYKIVAAATLVAALGVEAAFGQAAPQKTWKDGEYDLYKPVVDDTNPATRLAKLDAWKAKFPATDFEDDRLQRYLTTYQQLKKGPEIYSTAKAILAKDADSLAGLSALVYGVYLFNPPSASDMASAEQAATSLLTTGDKYFAAD